ncbi:MAG: hypothetical protein ACTSRS_21330 [Candidatus Helarchaeota archaeon]
MVESMAQVQLCLDGFVGVQFKRVKKREFTTINSSIIKEKRLEDYYFTRFQIAKSILNPLCPSYGSRNIDPFISRYRTVKRILGIVEDVEIERYRCKGCREIFSTTYENAPPKGHFHYEII